ncbi:MAG: hypothetical protein AAF573_08045, partial [Bacteroidota bacterium]
CYNTDDGDEFIVFYPTGTSVFPSEITVTTSWGSTFTLDDPNNNIVGGSSYQVYENFPNCTSESSSYQDYIISYSINGVLYECEIVDGVGITDVTPTYDPECPTSTFCYQNQLGLYFPNAYFPTGQAQFFFPNNPASDGIYTSQINDSDPNTIVYNGLPCDDNFTIVYGNDQICVIENGQLCEGCTPYLGPDCQSVFDDCGTTILEHIETNHGTGCKVWKGDCHTTNDIFRTGKVAIGTQTIVGGFKLVVKGGILTEQFKICSLGSNSGLGFEWCDYVFEEGYNLLSLDAVEKQIAEKGHLHNTPSAKVIEDSGGIDLLDVTLNQQEKIEEIFLHLIELDKQLDTIESELK